MKNIKVFFLSENFQFLEVKFSIYLNRRVLVMGRLCCVIVAFPRYLHLYSRLSLSRTRLFRISAYLEVKI